MKNILLTCAGGAAAIGVIKSLRDIDFKGKIVTIDSDPLAAGGFLSDSNYTVPLSDEPSYWGTVAEIIVREEINLILPTGDADIVHFATHRKILETKGIDVHMSDLDSINICQNKEQFFNECKNEFPLPKTTNWEHVSEFDDTAKIIAKPKRGSGSRGISVYDSYLDIPVNKSNYSEYIFQEYLPGKEYTVDVLCDMMSTPLVSVVRERLQVKAGISVKGNVIRDMNIEQMCSELSKHLKLKGPVCIQLKEADDGSLKFIEVNPRLGGGTYFTTLAGVNFMDIIVNKRLDIPEPMEITVVRYFNEIVV